MVRVGAEHLLEPYRSLVRALVEALEKLWGDRLVSVVVYGSVARGNPRRDSDVDLLVVGRGLPRSRFARQELFMKAEEEIRGLLEELWSKGFYVDFSPVILDIVEARRLRPIYLDMVEDAVIVYDKEGFMQQVLERLKARLEELGAERVWIGRRWYWRLKRDYRFGEEIVIE